MRFLKKGIISLSLLFTTLATPLNVSARAASAGHHGGHSGHTETVAENLMREAHEAEIRSKLVQIITDPAKGPKDLVSALDKRYDFFDPEDAEYLNETRKEVLGDSSKVPSSEQAKMILEVMHKKSQDPQNKVSNTIFLTIFGAVGGAIILADNPDKPDDRKKKRGPKPC
ncbi:MAG: hypothetical protein K8R48_09955 [Alphaproteobacteria bacterium]|nr:hypothetical protein [Alphaproteobacteria bacterium]